MAGEVTFVPVMEDLLAGQRLWWVASWRRPSGWLVASSLALILVLGIGSVGMAVIGGEGGWRAAADVAPLLGGGLGGTALMTWGYWHLPRYTRRIVRQQPSLLSETRWRWDNENVEIISEAGRSRIRWAELYRWLHDTRTIALLPQERMVLTLPRRLMTTECVEDLLATIRREAPQARSR